MLGVVQEPAAAAGGVPAGPPRQRRTGRRRSARRDLGPTEAAFERVAAPARVPPEPAWVPGAATPDPQDWACVGHASHPAGERQPMDTGVFVGIDVAQATLVVAVQAGPRPDGGQ